MSEPDLAELSKKADVLMAATMKSLDATITLIERQNAKGKRALAAYFVGLAVGLIVGGLATSTYFLLREG